MADDVLLWCSTCGEASCSCSPDPDFDPTDTDLTQAGLIGRAS